MKLGQSVLRHINFTLKRRLADASIRIPVLSGLKVGISEEKFLLDILAFLLPKLDGAFIDAGANLGSLSRLP